MEVSSKTVRRWTQRNTINTMQSHNQNALVVGSRHSVKHLLHWNSDYSQLQRKLHLIWPRLCAIKFHSCQKTLGKFSFFLVVDKAVLTIKIDLPFIRTMTKTSHCKFFYRFYWFVQGIFKKSNLVVKIWTIFIAKTFFRDPYNIYIKSHEYLLGRTDSMRVWIGSN